VRALEGKARTLHSTHLHIAAISGEFDLRGSCVTEKTSAEMLEEHIAGRLIADGGDRSPKDVIAQIFARNAVLESFIVPAVAEPLIVWILKGSATV
jgi:hypothetical protein